MKMKKIIALLLSAILLFGLSVPSFALSMDDGMDALKEQFVFGEGPVEGKYSVDYRYFSPVKENDSTKYPLVIWLHGMGDGAEDGTQVYRSNIAAWTSDEFRARFKPAGGAFIFAARSREENDITWEDSMIEPLRAAIDEFIAENRANIDVTRIYIGGYSMGGKMTLKMAIAYPEMFAAAFPICPAWAPDSYLTANLSIMPVWITSSDRDPLVNYDMAVKPTWSRIIENSNVPEACRLSTVGAVCYPDGTATSSAHHTWFAVNNDMFTYDNGSYYNMKTIDGNGNTVKLTYPDGMISWLSSYTSEYDGEPIDGTGNLTEEDSTDNFISNSVSIIDILMNLFKLLLRMMGISI